MSKEKQQSIRNLQRAKGVKDVAPEEKIVMQQIMDTMRVVFENYGYSPLETPILERSELYDVKFGQGEGSDVIQESFRLVDKAGRKLILRNEFTTSLSIFIASNPNLKMPFKRYEMGKVFRNGPIKAGRYRECWQCDVDIVGIQGPEADVESIEIALDIFKRLTIPIEILFNTRLLLNEILELAGVKGQELVKAVLISMDKFDKIGAEGVQKELNNKNVDDKAIDKILELINVPGSNQDKVGKLERKLLGSRGVEQIKKITDLVGSNSDVVFLPSLVRGQAYYTGPIFEAYAKDKSKISSSLAAGGRYDEMIGGYIQDGKSYPATGISFGLNPIYDYLVDKIKTRQKTVTQVYVVAMGNEAEKMAREVLKDLRASDIKSDIDMLGRQISKNLNYVNDVGIPWAVIIGEDEVRDNRVTLKEMESGEQVGLKRGKLVSYLKGKLSVVK